MSRRAVRFQFRNKARLDRLRVVENASGRTNTQPSREGSPRSLLAPVPARIRRTVNREMAWTRAHFPSDHGITQSCRDRADGQRGSKACLPYLNPLSFSAWHPPLLWNFQLVGSI